MMGERYVVFLEFDSLENRVSDAHNESKHELQVSPEEKALIAALAVWAVRRSQEKSQGHDKENHPRESRLILEVSWPTNTTSAKTD